MNKRDEAIQAWVDTNRPDLKKHLDPVIDDTADPKIRDSFGLLLAIGFEAGRIFQKQNPTAPDGPAAY